MTAINAKQVRIASVAAQTRISDSWTKKHHDVLHFEDILIIKSLSVLLVLKGVPRAVILLFAVVACQIISSEMIFSATPTVSLAIMRMLAHLLARNVHSTATHVIAAVTVCHVMKQLISESCPIALIVVRR